MAFDGTWNCTMDTPMGKQAAKITFATQEGRLTGTVSAAGGETEVRDGAVTGDSARWKCSITRPMPLTLEFDARLQGDTLSGTVKLGAFGNAAFSGTRA